MKRSLRDRPGYILTAAFIVGLVIGVVAMLKISR
jgi:hypothetical protein